MKKKSLIIILFFILTIFSNYMIAEFKSDETIKNINFTGARSSRYGIKPFPETSEWKKILTKINNNFSNTQATAIWIVGILHKKTNCKLGFPGDKTKFKDILFKSEDQNEEFLNFFDKNGIKVFLQVEPGNAHVPTLMHLVLNRYKHHKCVIGFGVDVEWYREPEKPGWGMKVDDKMAAYWEKIIKSFSQEYRLFLKHWDRNWMPQNYRGDIIFVSDSQMLKSFEQMSKEFTTYWADFFYPNTVGYQIGYPSDFDWWKKLENPVKNIGEHLANSIKQDCGIFWVDFTLRKMLKGNYKSDK